MCTGRFLLAYVCFFISRINCSLNLLPLCIAVSGNKVSVSEILARSGHLSVKFNVQRRILDCVACISHSAPQNTHCVSTLH